MRGGLGQLWYVVSLAASLWPLSQKSLDRRHTCVPTTDNENAICIALSTGDYYGRGLSRSGLVVLPWYLQVYLHTIYYQEDCELRPRALYRIRKDGISLLQFELKFFTHWTLLDPLASQIAISPTKAAKTVPRKNLPQTWSERLVATEYAGVKLLVFVFGVSWRNRHR